MKKLIVAIFGVILLLQACNARAASTGILGNVGVTTAPPVYVVITFPDGWTWREHITIFNSNANFYGRFPILGGSNQMLIPTIVSNVAHASSLTFDTGAGNLSVSGTNPVSGNVNILLTNKVVGTSGNYSAPSDSSVRTYSIFSDSPIAMLSTNATLNTTQVVTEASKIITIHWVTKQTNNIPFYLVWAKSQ